MVEAVSESDIPLYIPPEVARTIVDPKAHARQTPVHEAFTWLRRNNPLGVADPPDYNPFWVATRFADIQEISRHMRALFEELLPRLATLELDGEPRRSETQFIGGPKQLPIRWTLR